jgi:hypothetical protein
MDISIRRCTANLSMAKIANTPALHLLGLVVIHIHGKALAFFGFSSNI